MKPSDIESIFHEMTQIEIQAAKETAIDGTDTDQNMAAAYMLAIDKCRNILGRIMKDIK